MSNNGLDDSTMSEGFLRLLVFIGFVGSVVLLGLGITKVEEKNSVIKDEINKEIRIEKELFFKEGFELLFLSSIGSVSLLNGSRIKSMMKRD